MLRLQVWETQGTMEMRIWGPKFAGSGRVPTVGLQELSDWVQETGTTAQSWTKMKLTKVHLLTISVHQQFEQNQTKSDKALHPDKNPLLT